MRCSVGLIAERCGGGDLIAGTCGMNSITARRRGKKDAISGRRGCTSIARRCGGSGGIT